jgi:hypothetical protein
MIRRKNSFGYIDFIKGQYSENNLEYLQKLFDEMSIEEKELIQINDDFDKNIYEINKWLIDHIDKIYDEEINTYRCYEEYNKLEEIMNIETDEVIKMIETMNKKERGNNRERKQKKEIGKKKEKRQKKEKRREIQKNRNKKEKLVEKKKTYAEILKV